MRLRTICNYLSFWPATWQRKDFVTGWYVGKALCLATEWLFLITLCFILFIINSRTRQTNATLLAFSLDFYFKRVFLTRLRISLICYRIPFALHNLLREFLFILYVGIALARRGLISFQFRAFFLVFVVEFVLILFRFALILKRHGVEAKQRRAEQTTNRTKINMWKQKKRVWNSLVFANTLNLPPKRPSSVFRGPRCRAFTEESTQWKLPT